MIKIILLQEELKTAGIEFGGCSDGGVVWDKQGNEIQNRPDVAAVIAAHNPNSKTKAEKSHDAGMATLSSHNGDSMKNIPMPTLSLIVCAMLQCDHPDWLDENGTLHIP